MTEKELYAALRDCRNELCLRCGQYKEAHLGACDGCRWKDMGNIGKEKENLGKFPIKRRTAQFYLDQPYTKWTYYIAGTKNPCGCGSNCYHYEYDGKRVIGVCNGCGADIYELNGDLVEGRLAEGVWLEIDKPV